MKDIVRATLQVADTGTIHKIKIFRVENNRIVHGFLTGVHDIESTHFNFSIVFKNGRVQDSVEIDILDIGEGSNWVEISLKNLLVANGWTRIGTVNTKIQ